MLPPQDQSSSPPYDFLLAPLLKTGVESVEEMMGRLLTEVAQPIIRRNINAKLRLSWNGTDSVQALDAEDLCNEATIHVWRRLKEFLGDPEEKRIINFRGYVAVVSFRVCADYFRARFPERFSFKNKVLYLVKLSKDFHTWEGEDGELRCGLAKWRQAVAQPDTLSPKYEILLNRPLEAAGQAFPGRTVSTLPLADCLAGLLGWLEQPLEIDELVNVLAALQGIETGKPEVSTAEGDSAHGLEQLPQTQPKIIDTLVHREYLQQVWAEIRQLPPRQCAALLLNLREPDGGSALELFFLTGITQPAEVAIALGITLEKFTELWHHIPLDDLTIGEMVGATRQQVINLRKCARERLARKVGNRR